MAKSASFRSSTAEFQKQTAALFAAAHDTAARAWRKQIPFATGTDYADLLTVATEASELTTIGLTPMAAIRAATSQAAQCIGIAGRTGSIQPGLEADVLVIDGDPTRDITALRRVLLVVNDGHIVVNNIRK